MRTAEALDVEVVAGLPLSVVEYGAGTPLVLLHGFTGSAADWRPVAEVFGRERRVLTVDLPGHGRSPAPVEAQAYRMDRCVDALCRLLDSLGIERADWLGYSMGGRVALSLAVSHPERVRRLVLEGATPGIADPRERSARLARDEALAERIERDGVAAFVDEWMRQPFLASQRRCGRRAWQAARAARLRNSVAGLAGSLRGAGTGSQKSLWDDLALLSVSVLLIAGEEDSKFCKIAAAMAARLPCARVAAIADAGHNTHFEKPTEFLQQVAAFLRGDQRSDGQRPAGRKT